MNDNRQDTKYHKCELPGEQDDVVTLFIDAGMFVSVRRTLKRFTMVNNKHPYTRYYLKSICMFRHEEKGHLLNHYHMIHPFSMATFCYGIWMMIVLFFDFWVAPFLMTVVGYYYVYNIFFIGQLSHIVLMLLCFWTGYYDKFENTVVLKSNKIVLNYMKTYFIWDFFSMVWFLLRLVVHMGAVPRSPKSIRVARKILFLCKIGRYPYWFDMFKQIKLYTGMNHYLYQGLKIFLHFNFFLLMTHYILYNSIVELKDLQGTSAFRMGLAALEMVLMVDYGGLHGAGHVSDKICPIIFILLGFIVQLLLYTNFMQLWHKIYSAENKQTGVYNAFSAYMCHKALPVEKRKRIYLFLDFKYQRHFYKESSIRKSISERLRREIIIHASKSSTQKVELFSQVPARLLDKVMANLVSQIYLPGDVIIRAGSSGTSMFFILAGTVMVTTLEGKKVSFLRDGSHFGEIALIVNMTRVANVIAITPCELFKLSRAHFRETLVKYPELINEMIEMSTMRIAKTQSLGQLDMGYNQGTTREETKNSEFQTAGEDETERDHVNENL